MTSGKIVVVHGAADPALDSVLERGGLRRVMRMDDMSVWVFEGPGLCPSPAAGAGPPAAPGGPERLLLSVVQAAGVLGVGRTTAYQLIRAGQLEVVHVGRSVPVPVGSGEFGGLGAGSSRPAGTIRAVASGDRSQRLAARTA